uniref:CRAL-TRIO domain-containing protein n=1 Tax=Panagrellus redivivus TaxID=6233 RepID=A0A7E4V5F9_PANRE
MPRPGVYRHDAAMVASTSNCTSNCLMDGVDQRMTKSESQSMVTPKFNYDLNFDLKILQKVLKSADFLQDSGYKSTSGDSDCLIKSIIDKPAPPPACCMYGTGWMVADNLSDDGCSEVEDNWEAPEDANMGTVPSSDECVHSNLPTSSAEPPMDSLVVSSGPVRRDSGFDTDDEADVCLDAGQEERFTGMTQDGVMDVNDTRIKIREMTDILVTRFAFISGLKTKDSHPIMTFPDSRSAIDFEQYQLLVGYLLQVPPMDDSQPRRGYVIVIDRRLDKWSSVRLLFTYLTNYFPEPIRVVFLLKPEGVLQRALEVGYRNFAENSKFKVVVCQSSVELRHFIGGDCLTMDVGGDLKYNHLEWVQHRMDIERMKSSAAVIAESLSEFGRCLRETELPNDVETTERVLEAQTSEHDAIKEDFRISIRKGLSLLRQVRQLEQKPDSDLLSPTRLHNVTAIERMLVQLEDTERSFDAFWARHRQRLTNCLQLRRFEESFRKLRNSNPN